MLERAISAVAAMATWCWSNPDQLVIGAMSVYAIHMLAGQGGRSARWGCVAGLLAQPLWFWSGARHGMYVTSAMASFYGFSYLRGVVREFRIMEWARGRRG